MSNILVPNNGTTPVATETVTRDGTTEHIQLFGLVDTGANDAVGTGASGVSPATGGAGILGWLSTIAKLLGGTLAFAGSINNFPAAQGPGKNSSGTGQFVPIADSSVPINCSASNTQTLVPGVVGKSIYVCGFDFVSGNTGTVQFVYGSGNTALSGQYPVVAESGAARGTGVGAVLIVPAGQDLKITTSTSSATAEGTLSYTQY